MSHDASSRNMFVLRNALDDEFQNESDRGCAILTVCLLEETLITLFAKVLPRSDADVRGLMPRGRLSVGIANAYALGLLDDISRRNFKLVVDIRNIFAHKLLGGITFNSQEIRAKVDLLELPNMDAVPTALAETKADPRRHFMMIVDSIFLTLEWLIGRSQPIQPQDVPKWIIRKAPTPTPGKEG